MVAVNEKLTPDAGSPQNLPADNYYLLQDLLYRAVALTDSSGNVVEAYDCDAYGNTLIFTGPSADGQWFTDDDVQSSFGANEIIFCGYRLDPETENYYVRNRYYSPVLGRWLTRDPIGYQGGINLYEYAGGDPAGNVDASGLAGEFTATGRVTHATTPGSPPGAGTVGVSVTGTEKGPGGAKATIGGHASASTSGAVSGSASGTVSKQMGKGGPIVAAAIKAVAVVTATREPKPPEVRLSAKIYCSVPLESGTGVGPVMLSAGASINPEDPNAAPALMYGLRFPFHLPGLLAGGGDSLSLMGSTNPATGATQGFLTVTFTHLPFTH